jgi:hypothetical protein
MFSTHFENAIIKKYKKHPFYIFTITINANT